MNLILVFIIGLKLHNPLINFKSYFPFDLTLLLYN